VGWVCEWKYEERQRRKAIMADNLGDCEARILDEMENEMDVIVIDDPVEPTHVFNKEEMEKTKKFIEEAIQSRTNHPNRIKQRNPRHKSAFWCDVCDMYLVGCGQKCPVCHHHALPVRDKKPAPMIEDWVDD